MAGLNFDASVAYANNEDTSSLKVKEFTEKSWYVNGVAADVSLGTTRADLNPSLVKPVVTIHCKSITSTTCNIKYRIVASCMPRSTKCASTTLSAVTAVDITGTKTATVALNKITDGTTPLTCGADERIDIVSVKVLEANPASLNVAIKYQNTTTPVASIVVDEVKGASCYDSTTPATSVGFAKADANPDKTTPVVAIECLLANTKVCSVKYEVVGRCVKKSIAITDKGTGLASAAATTMDYYTRAIAVAVSMVAGAAIMYMRH